MKQTLWLKLGSIAVHAEELIETHVIGQSEPGWFDAAAIGGLLADREVRRFLNAPANKVLLPRKRSEDEYAHRRTVLDTSVKIRGGKALR